MRQIIPPVLTVLVISLGFQQPAAAHCEVPCGIYADQARFEAMLEDHTTVLKAMSQINELAAKTDAQSRNQLARWVANKESHATRTQTTIAQYFMAQRIKPGKPMYVEKLTAAHAVMLHAMKCKQTVDTKNADALKAAILAFHKAYEAK
jgi:nickel superoxide dismutase